jgi:BIM1-like copper acquisition factor
VTRFLRIVGVAVAVAVVAPAVAGAHTELTSPKPRSPGAKKSGPCGGEAAGKSRTTFTAGSRVTVHWREYIEHPGYFRVRYSPAGDKHWVTLADHVPDKVVQPGAADAKYARTVRLPSAPAKAATLQVIQVMTDSNPPAFYFSCADIRLVTATRY